MTLIFLKYLFFGIAKLFPVILSLLLIIISLGLYVGHKEKWTKIDSLYYAFITATTVGFGDFRPSQNSSKLLSILIALTGIILTGIIVAISLYALEVAISNERLFSIE